MNKLYLYILYIIAISFLIGGAILFSKTKSVADPKVSLSNAEARKAPEDKVVNKTTSAQNSIANEALNYEKLSIVNGNADIDLHASISENNIGKVQMNINYKLDNNTPQIKSLDASNISDIRSIFTMRKNYGGGFKFSNIVFNASNKRLYFFVEGKRIENYNRTTVYSYDLSNSGINKIYKDIGEFGEFNVSPDGRYNAFSYLSSSQNIKSNQKSTVLIFDCTNNKLVLNSNKQLVGSNVKPGDRFVYSYEFIKWKSNKSCLLKQTIRSKDGFQKDKIKTMKYDISDIK